MGCIHTGWLNTKSKGGGGKVMGLTWHHGQQQQRSPPPSGPLGWHREEFLQAVFAEEGSSQKPQPLWCLLKLHFVKAGKSSAKSSSGLQKGKLQFSTPNLHSECRKKTTKVRNE